VKRLPVVLALALAACATSSAFRSGERAERRQEFDRAVLEYSKAPAGPPRQASTTARPSSAPKLRASEEHTVTGRRLLGRGLFKEALDEFKLAYDLNPTSSTLPREIDPPRRSAAPDAPAPTIDQIKDRARERGCPASDLGPGAREPLGLSFRGASLKETYRRSASPRASTSSSIPSSMTSPSPSTSPTWASSRRSTRWAAWGRPSTACWTRRS